ncbi:MAG: LLM class flavin-dependent oxidoreductase [Bifidobacteriaceae bacterium]|jgi:alkanesulfonate monooxygenase SsuD/methylene tetrahydromethanopterin reductase-like flavin-dependent oxidoreductase (luciferase family)|nr:LLM class flavin-dependent oxidoreductase [Bifidobacteriaceae bacterium]
MSITSLSFVHIFPFAPDNPADGLEEGIKLFQLAEQLGYNAGYVRTRHLQYAPAAPAVLQAAIAERTSTIEIGNACIVGQYENPFNLAEELSLAAALARGRLRPGFSVAPPRGDDDGQEALLYGAGWQDEDFSRERLNKIRSLVAGEKLRPEPAGPVTPSGPPTPGTNPGDEIRDTSPTRTGVNSHLFSDRVEPHWPGLADKFWLASTSAESAIWAAQNRWNVIYDNFYKSNKALGLGSFDEAQAYQLRVYREHQAPGFRGQLAHGRVLVPTDAASPAQAAKYQAYLDERTPRTLAPLEVGDQHFFIRRDSVGTSRWIIDDLLGDPSFAYADELAILLPFTFDFEDYRQILELVATQVAPALGWRPAASRVLDAALVA